MNQPPEIPLASGRIESDDVLNWRRYQRTAEQWATQPHEPIRYLASGLLPQTWLGILNGDGGAGKTSLLSQLCNALSRGIPFLGRATTKCRPLALFSEDDAQLAAIRFSHMSPVGDFPVFPLLQWPAPIEIATSTRDGTVSRGPFFNTLCEMIGDLKTQFAALDHANDLFAINHNDTLQVNETIRLLGDIYRQFAPDGFTGFLLTQHISKTSMASGRNDSGSVQWHNKARVRISLTPPRSEQSDSDDVIEVTRRTRTLKVEKDNYGNTAGTALRLIRNGWSFDLDDGSGLDSARERQTQDRVLEFARDTLPRIGGRAPYDMNAPKGFVAQFRNDSKDASHIRGSEVHRALDDLIRQGKLIKREEGPPSKAKEYVYLPEGWPDE